MQTWHKIAIAKCKPIFRFRSSNIYLREETRDLIETQTALTLNWNNSRSNIYNVWLMLLYKHINVNHIGQTQGVLIIFLSTVVPEITAYKINSNRISGMLFEHTKFYEID